MFDTVWTAALALHRTAKKLPSGQSLLDFNYTNTNLSEMIYNEALNVTFFGLTVSIHVCVPRCCIYKFYGNTKLLMLLIV